MRIDLHTHSSASDGTASPAEVMHSARVAGLDVVALTDHDTVEGWAAAAEALVAGLTLVPGAEISARRDDGSTGGLHVLAYLFDPAEPDLAAELTRLRGERGRRAEVMVRRASELGAPVSMARVRAIAGGAPVGRPHLAQALLETGHICGLDQAFSSDWFGPGGRAYEPKRAPDVATVVRLVGAAGGVCVLAHPAARGRPPVSEVELRQMAADGLAGLEVDTPEHESSEHERLRALAGELDLFVTGGSDYHGGRKVNRLGQGGCEPAAYQRLLAAATGAQPVSAGLTG